MEIAASQSRQSEWTWQWDRMQDEAHQCESLFWQWVAPLTRDAFRGRRVLDAGCGGGHMLGYVKDVVREGVGVDLNTSQLVRRRFADDNHIHIYDGDIATWSDEEGFDIVYSIGVVHHTADPARTARNLLRLVRPGGQLLLWVYGHEGNFWARCLVESTKPLYRWLPRSVLWWSSLFITAVLTPVVYSVYRLPLPRLPYFEYFANWRQLSFVRNATNVFDKLNAPTTHFIKRAEIDDWFAGTDCRTVHVTPWNGISHRILVTRNANQQEAA
jgi:SAM-dependent methyltransferase